MFGLRTPLKATEGNSPSKSKSPKSGTEASNVKRSIGVWEAANADVTPTLTSQAGSASGETKPALPQESLNKTKSNASPKYKINDRIAEARACLNKGKLNLSASRNIKTEIKNGVTEALDRLYQLVKEAETALRAKKSDQTMDKNPGKAQSEAALTDSTFTVTNETSLALQIEEHSKLLLETSKQMQELKDTMEKHKDSLDRPSYASVTATNSVKAIPQRSTLHSVVVTSRDDTESGEEVLTKVRKTVDAKEGWVKVERVRKAKDRKIIMGFESKEERNKIKNRLEREGGNLLVEEVKNKDPLLVLRNVLTVNTDEDILKALRNQNRSVFHNLDEEENRMSIKYRRKTRNPHAAHVVISVSPTIWQRATEIGTAHIDLQRVKVEDQSPLVQCTRCLGYGHGKRFCKESTDLCTHCSGPHLKAECADWLANVPPTCRNCTKAKLEHTEHNAFSTECPIRKKWDDLARSTTAYC